MMPSIGMGCTIRMHSDSHAATIVKITKTQIHVQQDIATRTDKNGMSDSQTYTYAPNKNAEVEVFHRRKNGTYGRPGMILSIGARESYHDYSF